MTISFYPCIQYDLNYLNPNYLNIFTCIKYYSMCVCDVKFVSNPHIYSGPTSGHTLEMVKEVCHYIYIQNSDGKECQFLNQSESFKLFCI